jgi:hypothetical protein
MLGEYPVKGQKNACSRQSDNDKLALFRQAKVSQSNFQPRCRERLVAQTKHLYRALQVRMTGELDRINFVILAFNDLHLGVLSRSFGRCLINR